MRSQTTFSVLASSWWSARHELAGLRALGVLDLAPALPDLRVELIAEDGEQPRREVRAGGEVVPLRPGLHEGLLHEVVGPGDVGGERQRERAQRRQRLHQVVAELVRDRTTLPRLHRIEAGDQRGEGRRQRLAVDGAEIVPQR